MFEDELNSWLNDIESITDLSVEDKAKVTKAGASIFASQLEEEVKEKHYRPDYDTDEHLKDSVVSQNKNIDGLKDGTSTVGFNKNKAYIARFLNNGFTTKDGRYIEGDHFVENLRERNKNEILEAQAEEYKKIIKKARNN